MTIGAGNGESELALRASTFSSDQPSRNAAERVMNEVDEPFELQTMVVETTGRQAKGSLAASSPTDSSWRYSP